MNGEPPFGVVFFRTSMGREPVREWLKTLDGQDRRVIGEDVKVVQFRWPLGMPLVRKLEPDLWEVRSNLQGNRIARILFTVHGRQIALLHGFIKKSSKTPTTDLEMARSRRDLWQSEWE
jgi:phage-related protein